ncbi:hypothetical protein IFM61392_09805 [Aspergillus lentulus]|nr:hypothetical protein IFM61392_09805 [Aspergillus lentulus]
MPRKGRKAAKLWSLHPKLHNDVAQLLDEEGLQLDFFDADDEETNIEERDTNVMGRFICGNSGCHSRGWSSKKIAITILLDHGCYAERVTYWLKKWNGIEVERPDYSGQSRGPHDSELCEGCKAGHCPNPNKDLALVLAGLSI